MKPAPVRLSLSRASKPRPAVWYGRERRRGSTDGRGSHSDRLLRYVIALRSVQYCLQNSTGLSLGASIASDEGPQDGRPSHDHCDVSAGLCPKYRCPKAHYCGVTYVTNIQKIWARRANPETCARLVIAGSIGCARRGGRVVESRRPRFRNELEPDGRHGAEADPPLRRESQQATGSPDSHGRAALPPVSFGRTCRTC